MLRPTQVCRRLAAFSRRCNGCGREAAVQWEWLTRAGKLEKMVARPRFPRETLWRRAGFFDRRRTPK